MKHWPFARNLLNNKGLLFPKLLFLLGLLIVVRCHSFAAEEISTFEPVEIAVVKGRFEGDPRLWAIYDVNDLMGLDPRQVPQQYEHLIKKIRSLTDDGKIPYLIRLKPGSLRGFSNKRESAFEVLDLEGFIARFGDVSLPELSRVNVGGKSQVVPRTLFQVQEIRSHEWYAILDMTAFDSIEKSYHAHPTSQAVTDAVKAIEADDKIAYVIQRQHMGAQPQPEVIDRDELLMRFGAMRVLQGGGPKLVRVNWDHLRHKWKLFLNQVIRPPTRGFSNALIKGMFTFSLIFFSSLYHPVEASRVGVESAFEAAIVGGIWAATIMQFSHTFRNVFTKPNTIGSALTRAFIHSFLFALVINSIKIESDHALDMLVMTHAFWHASKSTLAKTYWKRSITKSQNLSRVDAKDETGRITEANNHDFRFEFVYDTAKAADLVDMNTTTGRSQGGFDNLLIGMAVTGWLVYHGVNHGIHHRLVFQKRWIRLIELMIRSLPYAPVFLFADFSELLTNSRSFLLRSYRKFTLPVATCQSNKSRF